ncbi:MAG: hypothetical protein MZV70_30645 [Desulfobacterales bacterium]|nr:hypothetical protein [Desulfobacterales bacterium]
MTGWANRSTPRASARQTRRPVAEETRGRYFKSVDGQTLSEIYRGLNREIVREEEETSVKDYGIAGALHPHGP